MGRKLSDYEKEDRNKIDSQIDTGAAVAGQSRYEEYPSAKVGGEEFGLCATCKNLRVAKTRFGSIYAECTEFYEKIKLRPEDPIIDCSYYEKLGNPSLMFMKEIAIILDIKKKEIGFKR